MSKYLILLALLVNIASAKTMQILLTEDNSIIFNRTYTQKQLDHISQRSYIFNR